MCVHTHITIIIMSLVRKQFATNTDTPFDCWIFVIRHDDGRPDEFWFRGRDIAEFLEYKKPYDALQNNVSKEYQQRWCDLRSTSENDDITPSNWQPYMVFISEAGLYALVMRSKKPEAAAFQKWIMENVLPSLRGDLLNDYCSKYRDVDELARLKLDALRGYVYLATTASYRARNTYKIGFTSNPEQRMSNLNAVRTHDDEFSYVNLWPVDNCRAAERQVFSKLLKYRLHKEFFKFDNDDVAIGYVEISLM